jgi:hypothetical protein
MQDFKKQRQVANGEQVEDGRKPKKRPGASAHPVGDG